VRDFPAPQGNEAAHQIQERTIGTSSTSPSRTASFSTVVNGKALTDKDALTLTVENGKPTAKLNGKEIDITKIECSIGAVAHCLCNGQFMENMKIPMKSAQGIGLQAEVGKFRVSPHSHQGNAAIECSLPLAAQQSFCLAASGGKYHVFFQEQP